MTEKRISKFVKATFVILNVNKGLKKGTIIEVEGGRRSLGRGTSQVLVQGGGWEG